MAEELWLSGDACYDANEYADALQWYTRAIEKDPAVSLKRYYIRVFCQMMLGCYSEVLQDANEELKKNLDDMVAFHLYVMKASCQKILGAVAGARISYEQAIMLIPDSDDTKHRLQNLMTLPKDLWSSAQEARVREVERGGSIVFYPSVNIFDTLRDAYCGAEAPTVITTVSPTTCDALQDSIPFTPPSESLTIDSLRQLMCCRKVDLPLAYSFLFYNVEPYHYFEMHMDVSIGYDVVDFILDVVAAELVADKSAWATDRAVIILSGLYWSARARDVGPLVSKRKIEVVLKALKWRPSRDRFYTIRTVWLEVYNSI